MKYIKDFNSWLNEKYPYFDNDLVALSESSDNSAKHLYGTDYDQDLQSDVSDLLFSFFDGGESKYKAKLIEFNTKYKTSLSPPEDWTSLIIIDNPEKVYLDINDFVSTYNQIIK